MFEVVGSTEKTLEILDTEDNVIEEHDFKSIVGYLRQGVKITGCYLDGDKLCDEFGDVLYKAPKHANSNLHNAKKAKNDEFYTQLADIEAELKHYPVDYFKDKVIYLPTDIAFDSGILKKSQFVQFFQNNAEKLQFKKLIATCLASVACAEGQDEKDVKNCYILERIETAEGYKYIERFEHCPSDAELGGSNE